MKCSRTTQTSTRHAARAGRLFFSTAANTHVIGPDFVSIEENDCYAFGSTREAGIANYALKHGV